MTTQNKITPTPTPKNTRSILMYWWLIVKDVFSSFCVKLEAILLGNCV